MSSPIVPPPPPPAPKRNVSETACAGGLYTVRRNPSNDIPEAIVFSADARGRSGHKQTPGQAAAHASLRKQEIAENRTVIPLLVVLRKLTNRGHLDVEVDPALVFGQLERLRHLRRELAMFNDHTRAEIDADPELSFRARALVDLVSSFGFGAPPPEHRLEFEALDDIIDFIETEYHENVGQARAVLKEDGALGYMALQELYHIGDTVLGELGSLGGTRLAYRVGDAYYEPQKSMLGNSKMLFHLSLEYVGAIGEDSILISFEEVLDDWPSVSGINSLQYLPVSDPAELQPFTRRGATAFELAQGHHYRSYRAGCFFAHRVPRGTAVAGASPSASVLASSGRIVIDASRGLAMGYSSAPGYDSASLAFQQTTRLLGVVRRANSDGESEERRKERVRAAGLVLLDRVPQSFLRFCWPALVGFSLNAKAWGHVLVDGLSDVEHCGDAWEDLVIPSAKKELLLALAAQKLDPNATPLRIDAVQGKGSGSLFLLHGPPGVGKTLTAEALAGHFGRPLYCLTFGELGSNAQELEARMNEVLQLCSAWRCVCLLDEGDALVERREKGALLLNSLVGVLLKALDSFEGLLFLTTNRVSTFDPAALSRVTLAIRYDPLGEPARAAIWSAVLSRAGCNLDLFDFAKLSLRECSGRDINNAARLALALAEHRKKELDQGILDEALAIVDDFKNEIANPHAF